MGTKATEKVKISFNGGAIIGASCTCNSDGKRSFFYCCSHTVAVLLTCAHDSHAVVSFDDLQTQVAAMPRDKVNELVLSLVTQYGGVEMLKAARSVSFSSSGASTVASVRSTSGLAASASTEAFRKEIRETIRDLYLDPHMYDHSEDSSSDEDNGYRHMVEVSRVREGFGSALTKIRGLAKRGDINDALQNASATTEESLIACQEVAASKKWFSRLVGDALNGMWIDLLIEVPLAPAERTGWLEKLRQWEKKYEVSFAGAEEAAQHGWDNPNLVRVLKGDRDVQFNEHNLITTARLAYLEKAGRTEEAINLARAMKVDRNRVVEDLLLVGRVDEAVEEALKNMKNVEEAYSLARRVRESHPFGAFKLVGRALDLIMATPHDYYRTRNVTQRDLILWMCNHAHECDVFMKTTSGVGPLSLPATAEDKAKEDQPAVRIDLTMRRAESITNAWMEQALQITVMTPKVLVPSLYDMCMAVIGEDYTENMTEEQQRELDDQLPITIQASLMMEMSVHLAMMHLRADDLYQVSLFLQSRDRQFMALRVGLRASTPSLDLRMPRGIPSHSYRFWIIKNAFASKQKVMIDKAVEVCSVVHQNDDPHANLELCKILSMNHRETAALEVAVNTADQPRIAEHTRNEVVDYIISLLKDYSADLLLAYVIQLKESGRHAMQLLFALAKLLFTKGYAQQAFELALECLDYDEPSTSHTSMYYHAYASAARRSTAKRDCARWVATVAEDLGCLNKAIKALILLAKSDPSLENYRRVKELTLKSNALASWDDIRSDILAAIKDSSNTSAAEKMEIFINEMRIDLILELLKNPTIRLFRIAAQALEKSPEVGRALADRLVEYVWLDIWSSHNAYYGASLDTAEDLGEVWDRLMKYAPKENQVPTSEMKIIYADIVATVRMVISLQASATAYGRLVAALRGVNAHYVTAKRPASEWAAVLRVIRDRHSKKGKLMGMLEKVWPLEPYRH